VRITACDLLGPLTAAGFDILSALCRRLGSGGRMCLDVSHVLGASQPKFGPFTDRIWLENSASKLRMPWAAKRSTRHNAYWESMGRHSGLPSHSTLESGTLAFSSPSTGGVWAGATKAPHQPTSSSVLGSASLGLTPTGGRIQGFPGLIHWLWLQMLTDSLQGQKF